jgi:hypothetical protein
MEYHLFASSNEPPELPDIAGWRRGRTSTGAWISVERSESLDPAGKPLAVEAWVKADKPRGVILANGGPAHGYALFLAEGKPHFAIRVKDELSVAAAKQKVVGKWAHLAGVLTADKQLQVFVDGEVAATAPAGGFVAEEPVQAIEVGADAGSEGVGDYKGPMPFAGVIDQVRVYHGAVTAADVKKHFQTPGEAAAEDAELVLDYSFDKGKAQDLSGNKNHGKLGGLKAVEGQLGTALQFTGKAVSSRGGHFVQYHWSVENPPLFARAMVLADDTLFVAGPPDFTNEDDLAADSANLLDPEVQERLVEQEAAMKGRRGALLLAVSKADGKTLAELKLDFPPTWDGMAAAGGRLYMSTVDGKVLCLAGE